jgi:hypothetical protein
MTFPANVESATTKMMARLLMRVMNPPVFSKEGLASSYGATPHVAIVALLSRDIAYPVAAPC